MSDVSSAGPSADPSVGAPWLGTGVRFPFRPDPATRRIGHVTGREAVRQSIETILDTEPGERIMRPEFGCGLRQYLMEPNSPTTRARIRDDVAAAITRWESRVELESVTVTDGGDPSLAWIDIRYVHTLDQVPENLVYPFYLR